MSEELEQAVREVVRSFEAAFAEERGAVEQTTNARWRERLLSQAFLLGPMSVLRAARRDRAHDAVANRGFARVEVGEPEATLELGVMTSSLGPAIAQVLGAVRRSAGDTVVARLGENVHASVRGLLGPLVDAGALRIEDAAATDGAAARAAIAIAPFYYARHDVERLVTHVLLELVAPSPLAEAGLELLLAASWDQRWFFLDRLRAEREVLATLGRASTTLEVTIVDGEGSLGFLEEVAQSTRTRSHAALAAFVYPMLEEQRPIEEAVRAALACAPVAVKNARPSVGFWANAGAPCSVEVPQLLRPAPPVAWCERRCDYERAPSFGNAAGTALRNAVPSALFS